MTMILIGCVSVKVTRDPKISNFCGHHVNGLKLKTSELPLQLLLHEQTEVEASQQILLLQEHLLGHHVDPATPGTSFPDSTLANPIVLCSKENNNVGLGIDKEVPAFPALPNLVSVENDATLAKSACAVGYAYR